MGRWICESRRDLHDSDELREICCRSAKLGFDLVLPILEVLQGRAELGGEQIRRDLARFPVELLHKPPGPIKTILNVMISSSEKPTG